ncbi:bifunctional isochorismate lyase / aryl carrier protein [Poseidonocella pacifica]|uniref:Bifunctional isochorismate lyase / aryl carrier protein n=1 Tax=Poseidonocella pacifica TaxID=871651 RepID=A0A1I0V599_9RHOB|nr:isochorismatase family protein [Poseidonocella pacifica]SFA71227.1 bifunctional isochorismate lyase / aryl carrier protein [Poseidonocella pacifica]
MSTSKSLPKIASYELPRADELPASKAPFSLDWDRAALLIHDMQRYFCAAFVEGESPLRPMTANIAGLAEVARAKGAPVFYTAQDVQQDRRDRGLQAELWGPGMQDPEAHRPILTDLAPLPGDHVLTKHRYSAFQRSNLAEMMQARGRDQLVICGIYAHIGCMLTAADAFMRDIEPFFVADALGDFSREKHDLALSYVAGTCGVVINTAGARA